MCLCLSIGEFKCTLDSPLAALFLGLWNRAQTWGIKYSLKIKLRMTLDDLVPQVGAASHHDAIISPRLRPRPRLQRLRPHGDGRDFLSRGTVSHPDDQE